MQKETVYLGMDVHKETIALAAYVGSELALRFQKTIINDNTIIKKQLKKIEKLGTINSCYEAGFSGYNLYRFMDSLGYKCQVIAPSLVPKMPGDKIKTDRKDAIKLAGLLRANLLTKVTVPTIESERVRGFVRLRYQMKGDLARIRQRILKFLQIKGLVFNGTKANWTITHRKWLDALKLEEEDKLVFADYLALMSYLEIRLKDIDQRIEKIAKTDYYWPKVQALTCLKGISTFSAMIILVEVGDFKRFSHPRELMSYVGLTPRERSSGSSERKGHITKCGKPKLRHIIVEAAWQYKNKPFVSRYLAKRHEGQSKEVVLHATKAMHRLYKRYWALQNCKQPNIAVVAVARELTGFIWAIMKDDFSKQEIAA